MATTTDRTRPAVDVDHSRGGLTRAGLALVLGILSIPGVTLAWDLPAGGFWIGVPLAVAAIVVGVRARREDHDGRVKATVGIVLASLALLSIVAFMAADLAG